MMARRGVMDVVGVGLVVCAAYLVGVWTVQDAAAAGKQPMFYQSSFAPAVMLACGFGYHNVSGADDPPLMAFLLQQRDDFNCADLPAGAPRVELDSFQGFSRYFETSVAVVWRLRGIRWAALLPLFGLMVAASALATYGLLRIVSPPIVAVVGTFVAAFSPMALANLVNLRDYAKAPFVLGLLWILAAVLRRPRSTRTFVGLALGAAVLEGVGLGFRTDLWLMLPLIVLVFGTARVADGTRMTTRLTAAVCFVALFGAIAWPVVRGYARGNNTAHVVLLGFAAPFDAPLDVTPAAYTLGRFYNDSYVYARVSAFAELNGVARPPYVGTPGYDLVSEEYLSELVRMFPGDVATRAVAAFMGVLRSPFAAHAADLAYVRPSLRRAFAIRERVVLLSAAAVEVVAAAVVVCAVLFEPWTGVVALLVFLALSSSAMLQFHPRHFFYIEVLIWLPFWAVIGSIPQVGQLRRRRVRRTGWITAVAVFVGGPVMAAATIFVTRSIQRRESDQWIATLRATHRTAVPIHTEPISPDRVRLVVPAMRTNYPDAAFVLANPVTASRYAIVVGGPSCDRVSVPLTFRYESTVPFNDLTEQENVALPLEGGEVTLYESVFEFDTRTVTSAAAGDSFLHTRFEGIETDAGSAHCIERIDGIPERAWPQPVTAATDAPGASWYERLDWEPSRDNPLRIVTLPAAMPRSTLQRALAATLDDHVSFTARAVRARENGFRVDGRVEGPFTYLQSLADHRAVEGEVVIVKGDLGHGGITIGLQQHGRWAQSVNVTHAGPFLVAIAVPTAGDYQVVVANCLLNGSTSNSVSVSRMGWASQ